MCTIRYGYKKITAQSLGCNRHMTTWSSAHWCKISSIETLWFTSAFSECVTRIYLEKVFCLTDFLFCFVVTGGIAWATRMESIFNREQRIVVSISVPNELGKTAWGTWERELT